ncbi:hypothetical protein [Streptomyces mirabilis]|uniref:hypothetical protein n=1 Tax=Streptomyces mirabilis TaxID=68239 RepID=UPI00369B98E8
MTITKIHARHFAQGRDGTYTIAVGNAAGAAPTNSTTVTVHDTLPPGSAPTASSARDGTAP